jgi:hypothetical protein
MLKNVLTFLDFIAIDPNEMDMELNEVTERRVCICQFKNYLEKS